MLTLAFWRAVIERALKTAAQTAIATIGTTAAFNEVNWGVIGMVVALATVLSVLMSIASAAFTDGSPSLTSSEVLAPAQIVTLPISAIVADPVVVATPSTTANADGTITTTPDPAATVQ